MNPYDDEASMAVSVMPSPQLRDYVPAVDSSVSPEFYQDNLSLQAIDSERLAVEPRPARDFRRGLPLGEQPTASAPQGRSHESQDKPSP